MSKKPSTSEKDPKLFSRRNALATLGIIGSAIVADRLGLFNTLKQQSKESARISIPVEPQQTYQTTSQKPFPTTKAPDFIPESPEYDEWAAKIELPKIDMDFDSPLSREEIEKNFLPPDIDRQKLRQFYRRFDFMKDEILRAVGEHKNPEKRRQLMFNFVDHLFKEYAEANKQYVNQEETFSPDRFQKNLAEINYLLAAHGAFILADNDAEGRERFTFFEVEEIHDLKIEFDGRRIKFPLFFLKNQQNLTFRPKTQHYSGMGEYIDHGNYIIICKANGAEQMIESLDNIEQECAEMGRPIEPVEPGSIFEDHLSGTYSHEGAHATLEEIKAVKSGVSGKSGQRMYSAIKKKGVIRMQGYSVPPEDYRKMSNRMLHELFASGVGLMNSGKAAHLQGVILGLSDIDGYQYVTYFLFREVAASPYIDDELRSMLSEQIRQKSVTNEGAYVAAVNQIPYKELHKIGESMAKLVIYLTQKD